MSFFDDAVSGAKDFGSAVSKKTGKLVDTARLKMNAADITGELNNRYKALGKAVYDARKSGTDIDGIIDECVKSIDALNERLDEVRRKIAGMKNKVICSSCGAAIEPRSVYCSRCGVRMEAGQKKARQPKDDVPAPEVITVED
ncbi:MAG: zinc-ribbon domain-containing protein [Ruminococcaceae bacterium]|nr:zinc-ribbon domain-containing protein [Oscillospiraceae bacterium]